MCTVKAVRACDDILWYAGKFGYYLTFVLQWLNLLCANVGLVVLAGESLKVIVKPLTSQSYRRHAMLQCVV